LLTGCDEETLRATCGVERFFLCRYRLKTSTF
jgi:hypothetical protein